MGWDYESAHEVSKRCPVRILLGGSNLIGQFGSRVGSQQSKGAHGQGRDIGGR